MIGFDFPIMNVNHIFDVIIIWFTRLDDRFTINVVFSRRQFYIFHNISIIEYLNYDHNLFYDHTIKIDRKYKIYHFFINVNKKNKN